MISVISVPWLVAGLDSGLLPAEQHALPSHPGLKFEWDSYARHLSYLQPERSDLGGKLLTLQKVASLIVENAIDIDPAIVAAVNEEFWNLA